MTLNNSNINSYLCYVYTPLGNYTFYPNDGTIEELLRFLNWKEPLEYLNYQKQCYFRNNISEMEMEINDPLLNIIHNGHYRFEYSMYCPTKFKFEGNSYDVIYIDHSIKTIINTIHDELINIIKMHVSDFNENEYNIKYFALDKNFCKVYYDGYEENDDTNENYNNNDDYNSYRLAGDEFNQIYNMHVEVYNMNDSTEKLFNFNIPK
jgi:hypothetical protein